MSTSRTRYVRDFRGPSSTPVIIVEQEMERLAVLLKEYLGYFPAPDPWRLPSDGLILAQTAFTRLLLLGKDPTNLLAAEFKFDLLQNPRTANFLEEIHDDKFPTYLEYYDQDRKQFLADLPEEKLISIARAKKEVLLGLTKILLDAKPSAICFGTVSGWIGMQLTKRGVLCNRPGYQKTPLALKLLHQAFYQFHLKSVILGDALEIGRIAAYELSSMLTLDENVVSNRAKKVLEPFQLLFPSVEQYIWEAHQKDRRDTVNSQTWLTCHKGRKGDNSNVLAILVNIKLEVGGHGDGYMQSSRQFDEMVDKNPQYNTPLFIVTIAGPNIKVCGGWADPIHGTVAVDVFETLFVCQDVAYVAREQLADCLCRLKHAVSFLPQSHVLPVNPKAHQATDLPCVFETYEQFKGRALTQDKFGIRLSRRLLPEDLRHSVFLAHAEKIPLRVQQPPAIQAIEGNCIAKLIYGGRYGVQVHRALEPEFAPILFGISESGVGASLLLIQFLFPPTKTGEGWLPLENLGQEIKAGKHRAISDALDNLLEALRKEGYVHGDLRPINLMVAMANLSSLKVPVQIKALDFEWAGPVGKARYPTDRSKGLGYPGSAGHLIGPDDDKEMIRLTASC